jgi:hypothetical protein
MRVGNSESLIQHVLCIFVEILTSTKNKMVVIAISSLAATSSHLDSRCQVGNRIAQKTTYLSRPLPPNRSREAYFTLVQLVVLPRLSVPSPWGVWVADRGTCSSRWWVCSR